MASESQTDARDVLIGSIDGAVIAWVIFMVGLRLDSLLDQDEVLMNNDSD